LEPAAGGPVGLGQDQGNVVARLAQGVEGDAGELGRTGKDQAHGSAQARAASRSCLRSLLLMRVCLSWDRYSTNTLPSRWSSSCCTQTASRPSASNSYVSPCSLSARTRMLAERSTLSYMPGTDRQPSS